MSFAGKAKQLAAKAQAYAAGNKGKIGQGIQKAQQSADAKTGGKYNAQLGKAAQRADAYIEKLPESPPPSTGSAESPTTEPDPDPPHRATP